uniref:Uncharacterized protein n=1 Tax=Timema tahoe TaxID=61484 RepID=A0A7R9IJ39_9NEOP|nr:unnamed protein product [Timema tahoe]
MPFTMFSCLSGDAEAKLQDKCCWLGSKQWQPYCPGVQSAGQGYAPHGGKYSQAGLQSHHRPSHCDQADQVTDVRHLSTSTLVSYVQTMLLSKHQQRVEDNTDDTWYSIFPVENEELVYGSWEDEVIWDSENMARIPKPKILTLDPNDENIVLGIPDDVDPAKQRSDSATPAKVKIPHPHVKKSKILLGKAGPQKTNNEQTPDY